MKNSNLSKAKAEKNDEFYTRLDDIEIELSHYQAKYFKDKAIYLPCDVALEGDKVPKSNFVKYFQINRVRLGYKKLIATSINNKKNLYILEQDGTEFYGYCPEDSEYVSGDYRSEYCQKLFKEADVVVTNPPFSLFRDFVNMLEQHSSLKFSLIGNMNALHYKDIFPLILNNKLWLGYNSVKVFAKPDGTTQEFGNIVWYTNFDIDKRHTELILTKKYESSLYHKYDNIDAINVNKITDIPCDYYGIMGVPDSFLNIHNPNQFELLGCTQRDCHDLVPYIKNYNDYWEMKQDGTPTKSKGSKTNDNGNLAQNDGKHNYYINDKGHVVQSVYSRVFIRRKRVD